MYLVKGPHHSSSRYIKHYFDLYILVRQWCLKIKSVSSREWIQPDHIYNISNPAIYFNKPTEFTRT